MSGRSCTRSGRTRSRASDRWSRSRPAADGIAQRTTGRTNGAGPPAVNGSTVCHYHGGAYTRGPPQTPTAAAGTRRSGDRHPREGTDEQQGAAPIERIRAAKAILDRAGHCKEIAVEGEVARELLVRKILQIRDQTRAEQAARDIEGEVVDDGGEQPEQ